MMKEQTISQHYLRENPNHIFVFGDNTVRKGKGGAAILRDEPNTYGFITKKIPTHGKDAYYKPNEYKHVYKKEISKLIQEIENNPDKLYLISRLGAGLANKHRIWQKVIEPNLVPNLDHLDNVKFLWSD